MKLGVLVSGRGSNLQALIDSCADPDYPAEIAVVVSNAPGAPALERAAQSGIQTALIDHKTFDGREPFEAALNTALQDAGAELVCLAGFMRLLTGEFIENWPSRLINIHPSLLPAFKGLHVQQRAIDAGVRFSGCTVHFVSSVVDGGPIIAQAVVPVHQGDDEKTLAGRILEQEHRLYPLVVRLIAEGRCRVVDEKVVFETPRAPEGVLINPAPEGVRVNPPTD